jgi:hypothetical protein
VSTRRVIAVLLAALAIAARVGFITSGKIPFDSDEAVEALMAVHVLNGELPAFFWGQAFKGVPEVYVAAMAFALFGPSVAALKSVTLGFFAAYVALNFTLLDIIASRWLAVASSLLLIFSPPALVFWSLAGSAEYIVIMLLGTMLVLLCLRAEDASPAERAAIGVIVGLGLWVHQLFVAYLMPALLILALRSRWWQQRAFHRPGKAAMVLAAIAGLYLILGVIAFVTGGISFQLGPVMASATAPQKMIRIAAGFCGLAGLTYALSGMTRQRMRGLAAQYWSLVAGFVAGYLPVLLYSAFVEPARSPARVANVRQLLDATPDMFGNIVPILAGFKVATTERLPLPLAAIIPGTAALAAYLWANRRRVGRAVSLNATSISLGTDFFPLFVVFMPALFLFSGAYIDTQSYRYLIPWYAGLSVAWAAGSLTLALGRQTIASCIVGTIIAVHAWQQVVWYRMLTPDTQSLATIECLKRHRIRGGYADYWTAYKLTFLSKEEIVIAPTNGVDRYPAYTELVRSLPSRQITRDPGGCN